MSMDEIIKTKRGEYRVVNDLPQGIGRMITVKKIKGTDKDYEEILGSAEIFQVYNHKKPLEIVAFTKEKWLKPYIGRYVNASKSN